MTLRLASFDAASNVGGEFAGRQLGRIDLLKPETARGQPGLEIQSYRAGASLEGTPAFVEGVIDSMLAAFRRGDRIGQSQ